MATLVQSGYPQIEINNCMFRRTGNIEAQCKADLTEGQVLANGMIVEVDGFARTVKPTVGDSATKLYGVNYSTEHIYDERAQGLKNYANDLTDGFYPRIGILTPGDIFTTNAVNVTFDHADFTGLATAAALFNPSATVPGYLEVGATGHPVFRALEKTTMPDGQPAIKFQVVTL